MRFIRAIVGLMLAGGLVACGETTPTVTERVTTVVETVEAPASAAGSEVAESESEAEVKKSPTDDGAGDSGGIRVPNVVGKDHQLAQDTMQAAGLYVLDEEDATGQGRLLIIDRNWTVVEQDPPAGSTVDENETITLRSKKDGE